MMNTTLERPGLRVAVAATDPVRRADLSARVALSGHRLAESEAEADIVLTDAPGSSAGLSPTLRRADYMSEGPATLPPSLSAAQLDAALRAVAVGLHVSLPPPRSAGSDAEPARALLTPRELEILACLVEGLSNKAMARRLGISAHTVKFHLEAVFTKLGATSRAEAVAKGLRRGLILF